MNAYITLDYELFMGETTGDVMSCLIRPMEELCKLARARNLELNVFVDAAYLLRLQQLQSEWPQLKKDFDLVTQNISQLDQQGHYIQLHIHPQWQYSTFDGEKWIMDKEHYKLSDLSFYEQRSLIINGVDLLNSLIKKPISAFRAGGYSISNFAQLADVFQNVGIRYDTSVLRGEKISSQYQEYDYSQIPLLASYPFNTSPLVAEDGPFTELPISTIVVSSLRYLIEKRKKRNLDNNSQFYKQWGNGSGIGYPGTKIEQLSIRISRLFMKKAIRASIDGLGGGDLEQVYNYCRKTYKGDCFVLIGHPKLLTPYSIKCLDNFIVNHPDITFCGIH